MNTNINRIRFIKRKDIDLLKYTNLVEQSTQPSIYNQAWYLDATADNWGVLVLGDYEVILPIPYTIKFGFKIIYQPFFTRELSIFPQNSQIKLSDFIKEIPSSFKKIDFNYFKFETIEKFSVETVHHQELDLSIPYSEIYSNYSKNTKRLIKKATKLNCEIRESLDIDAFIHFFKQNTGKQVNYTPQHYNNLKQVINIAINNNKGTLLQASIKNTPIAYGFYLIQEHRITYLKGSANEEGKKKGAMFLLMDSIIKYYSEQGKILDFGGSKIESIALFYKKFGAKNRTYYSYSKNETPWIVKKGKNIRNFLKI